MGRTSDKDVQAAFVEFRAKEDDKCLSVQCIYCQQIRAKNTSRQRAHLLECNAYLDAMKDVNPDNSIIREAATHVNGTPTPSKLPGARSFQIPQAPSIQVPKPGLERDFRMSVRVNPKISVGPSIWGQRDWVTFIDGHWNGRWGKGTVVPGGQDSQLVASDLSTHLEASYLLQTSDMPPAYITVKTDGWRTGTREVLEKLFDPDQADTVDPRTYLFRLYIRLETGDQRYLHVNTGMWIGSGMRRGAEVIYDAYRVT